MLDGEPLSPELVLVCPELAERARALLPDRPELWARRDDPVASPGAAFESVGLPQLDLRHDDDDAAQRRLEELTSLVDRIATDWERVDGRLAQLERAVARMEAALAVAATPPAPWLETALSSDEEEQLHSPTAEQEPRARTGLIGTLVVVASVMAAMVAVELLPTFEDRPRLAVESEGAVPTALDSVVESSDGRPSPVPTTTTSVGGAAAEPAVTQPRRSVPSRRSETTTTTPARAAGPRAGTQTAPSTGASTTTSTDEFKPARVFVWLARDGATVYDVTFLRNGNTFYSARVSRPRLTLPERIQFTPGSYRWIVRPGAPGQALGRPIVDSTFTIEPS